MKRLILPVFFCVPLVLCFTLPGCGGSTGTVPSAPIVVAEQTAVQVADSAGEAAALGYLAIEQPTSDQAAQIKVVTDVISDSLKSYQENGFSSQVTKLTPIIDSKIANQEIGRASCRERV